MNTPIFDLLCVEYPDLHWEQGTVTLLSYQGPVRVAAIGPLRVL